MVVVCMHVVAGDRLLQIGVGSGIKCGVNVWRAVRDIHDVQDAWVSTAVDDMLRQHQPQVLTYGVCALVPEVQGACPNFTWLAHAELFPC